MPQLEKVKESRLRFMLKFESKLRTIVLEYLNTGQMRWIFRKLKKEVVKDRWHAKKMGNRLSKGHGRLPVGSTPDCPFHTKRKRKKSRIQNSGKQPTNGVNARKWYWYKKRDLCMTYKRC